MEDDPNYLRKMVLDLLTHRDHSLPSSQNILTLLCFLWPIKTSYMDHVKGETNIAPLCFRIQVRYRRKRESGCD